MGILGLLLGFALSMAIARWDTRRVVIVDEANATLTSLIGSANAVIDLHELRLWSLENHLPSALFYLLLSLSAGALVFLAWSFGAAAHRGRLPMVLLAIFIGAVLLLIMNVNRPQRGVIQVGVAPLERLGKVLTSAPWQEQDQGAQDQLSGGRDPDPVDELTHSAGRVGNDPRDIQEPYPHPLRNVVAGQREAQDSQPRSIWGTAT